MHLCILLLGCFFFQILIKAYNIYNTGFKVFKIFYVSIFLTSFSYKATAKQPSSNVKDSS